MRLNEPGSARRTLRDLRKFLAQPGNILGGIAFISVVSLGLKYLSSASDSDGTGFERASAVSGRVFGFAGKRPASAQSRGARSLSSVDQRPSLLTMVEPFGGWDAEKNPEPDSPSAPNERPIQRDGVAPQIVRPEVPRASPPARPARASGSLDHQNFGQEVNRSGGMANGARIGGADLSAARANTQNGPAGSVGASTTRPDAAKGGAARQSSASPASTERSGPPGSARSASNSSWSGQAAGSALSWGGASRSASDSTKAASIPAAAAPASAAAPAGPDGASAAGTEGQGEPGRALDIPALQYGTPQQFVDRQADFLVNYLALPASADFAEIARIALIADSDAAQRSSAVGYSSYAADLQAAHDCQLRLATKQDNFTPTGSALDCQGTNGTAFTMRSAQASQVAALQAQAPSDQNLAQALWDFRRPWDAFQANASNPPTYNERLAVPSYAPGLLARHLASLRQVLTLLNTTDTVAQVFADEKTELAAAKADWTAAFDAGVSLDERPVKAADAGRHLAQAVTDAYTAASMMKKGQQQ